MAPGDDDKKRGPDPKSGESAQRPKNPGEPPAAVANAAAQEGRTSGTRLDIGDPNAIATAILADLFAQTKGDRGAQRILLLFTLQRLSRQSMKQGTAHLSQGIVKIIAQASAAKAFRDAGKDVPPELQDYSKAAANIGDGIGELVNAIIDFAEIGQLQEFITALESNSEQRAEASST